MARDKERRAGGPGGPEDDWRQIDLSEAGENEIFIIHINFKRAYILVIIMFVMYRY